MKKYLIIIIALLIVHGVLAAAPVWNTLTANPHTVNAGDSVEIRATVSSSDNAFIFGCVREVPAVPRSKYEFFCDHGLEDVQNSRNLICRGKAPFKEGEITVSCMARNLRGENNEIRDVKFTVNSLSGNRPPVWEGLSIQEGGTFNGGDTVTVVADGAYDEDGDGLYFGCSRSVPSINPFIESSYDFNFGVDLTEYSWGDPNFEDRWSLQDSDFFNNPLEPISIDDNDNTGYEFFCEDHKPNDDQRIGDIICRGKAPYSRTSSTINLLCMLHDGELHTEPETREISFEVNGKSSAPPLWYGEHELEPAQAKYNTYDELEIRMKGVSDDDDKLFFQCVEEQGKYICEH